MIKQVESTSYIITIMKKYILFFALTVLLCPISSAMAQDPAESHIFMMPGTDFENHGENVREYLKRKSFETTDRMPVGVIYTSIVHPEFLEPHQFGLLFQKANSETGCFNYTPIQYEASYIEHYYMDINLKYYRRGRTDTQDPTFDCDQKSKVVSGMIVLNAKELADKKIRQIRLGNGNVRDPYDVTVTADRVRLTPQSMIAFKAVGLTGPDKRYLEYHFADKTLLTLQVPMAQNSEDITDAIHALGKQQSLVPVIERDGLDTSGENKVFYFTDPNGTTLDQMGENGYVEFGAITVTRPYDTAQGRVGTPVTLKVFATKPDVRL